MTEKEKAIALSLIMFPGKFLLSDFGISVYKASEFLREHFKTEIGSFAIKKYYHPYNDYEPNHIKRRFLEYEKDVWIKTCDKTMPPLRTYGFAKETLPFAYGFYISLLQDHQRDIKLFLKDYEFRNFSGTEVIKNYMKGLKRAIVEFQKLNTKVWNSPK